MNSDIRIAIAFKGHRKRAKLNRIIGTDATGHLIDLWLTAALDRPDGVLTGWDAFDIATAANWPGDARAFVEALTGAGWLDTMDDGTLALHDWAEHQQWASGAKARSDAARQAAAARWKKRTNGADDAGAMRAHSGGNAGALRKTCDRNAPFLSLPIHKKTFSSDSAEVRLANLLLSLIRKNHPAFKEPNLQAWAKHIDLAIRVDGRDPGELEMIIRWCQSDPFWHKNILSAEKLRKQFDRLVIQANGDNGNGHQAAPGPADRILDDADLQELTR